jgi:hypothetical protein
MVYIKAASATSASGSVQTHLGILTVSAEPWAE